MIRKEFGIGKLFAAAVLGVCLLVVGKTDVQASSLVKDAGVAFPKEERSLRNDVDHLSDTQYNRTRSLHLNYGAVELDKVSPTRAGILGTTQCHHVCPEVYLTIAVDRYDKKDDAWYQWRYWDYEATNTDHLSKDMEIIVLSGYYYSVRGYHSCVHDDTVETITTQTDGLYIGVTDEPVD